MLKTIGNKGLEEHATRDHVLFYLNGQPIRVQGADAFLSLSSFLRRHRRLTGTKIVCEEGDCGACSVLVSKLSAEQPDYRVVNSCILFLFQLEGQHVVTVEGIGNPKDLNAVQQAMIDCHGSQCGFCTPGFVAAISASLEKHGCASVLTKRAWKQELSGNLCRCTGYESILDACASVGDRYAPLAARYDHSSQRQAYLARASEEVVIECLEDGRTIHSPTSLARACELKNLQPDIRLVAGATDIGVQTNKGRFTPVHLMDLSRVAELRELRLGQEVIEVGAGVTWTEFWQVTQECLSQFEDVLYAFGSPQIRNAGTVGGNIANASPIADSLPLFHVLDAELELVSIRGSRIVNMNDFYLGYKQLDLRPDELIAKVRIPRPSPDYHLALTKVSRRKDMDISTFTAAMYVHVEERQIVDIRIALGGVGPVILRMREIERSLLGEAWLHETLLAAGEEAARSVSPLTDVRGSADYRRQLVKNAFLKLYYQLIAGQAQEA